MPIEQNDLIVLDPDPIRGGESTYLPEVVKGLATTFKHLVGSVHRGKRSKTMCYPEERREDRPVEQGGLFKDNFRGVHRLNRDEQGRVKCVACFMCSTACPASCITIVAAEAPWDDRETYPVKFEIDELKCIFCGMCEEACPCNAIELTPVYHVVGQSRQEMIYDKDKLLSIYDATVNAKPM